MLSENKDKDRVLKVTWEKKFKTHKESPISLSVDFSTENLQARREWDDIFKVLKEKAANQDTVSGKSILQKSGRKKDFLK